MRISDNVYALKSTKGAYAFVIKDKEITLIDTGFKWIGKRLLKELQKIGVKPKDIKNILLTHHDVDHIGNVAILQRLSDAAVWASKEDIPYLKGELKRPGIKKIFTAMSRLKKLDNIQQYRQDQKFGDISIVPTPGHTPGHVCILYKDCLFVGDLVKNKNGKLIAYPNLNWDVSKLKESIGKVAHLPFKWVCVAHGEPIERGMQWEEMLNQ